jgi:hypothetical protein
MTTETQKWLELRYVTKAYEKLGKSWSVDSAPDESDWPDILAVEDGHKFGIEIREIFPDESTKGSVNRRREANNDQSIRDIAKAYYEDSDLPISLKFIGDISNQTAIVNKLWSASKDIPDMDQVRLELSSSCTMYIRKLPSRFENYNRWTYVSDRAGWVGKLDTDFIQEKIDEKSSKLEKYTRNIDDVRLLLVCNRDLNSGKFVYSPEGTINPSGFKEVYFLSYPDSACILSN